MSRGRPRVIDSEVRKQVSHELGKFLVDKRISRTAFAKRAGISRASLHEYLRGARTPSPETLEKLIVDGGIPLQLFNLKTVTPEDFPTRPQQSKPEPVQAELPFEEPVFLESENRNVTIGVERKEAGSLQLTVNIKVA